ncbi:MAG: magnesium/cobalt transporter CorA [Candidatus Omnitrophota bacterium]
MARFINLTSRSAGLPPGTIIPIMERRNGAVKITIIDYDENNFQEKVVETVEECFSFRDTSTVTWINIDGIYDTGIIEKIGQHFNIHPLVLEDIVNTAQRPKYDDFDDYIFVVFKMLCYDEEKAEVRAEQVSIIFGSNFVISFQEQEGDVFGLIRERIRNFKGRVRKMKADYLSYSLLDATVDNYFLILEKFGERIEDLEDGLINHPAPETLQEMHDLKQELIFLRKSIWPLREVISGLERSETLLIDPMTDAYFRDLYDHTIQVMDSIETYRDMTSSMLDIYLSSISNKLNDVMKRLTVFTSIFMPLTFLTGLYGMNFRHMPELEWWAGYYALLGIMLVLAVSMLIYFKRKRWI